MDIELGQQKQPRLSVEEKKKRIREYMRKYYHEHKARYRENEARRRGEKRNGRPKFHTLSGPPRKQRGREYREVIVFYLINRDGLLCWRCQNEMDGNDITIDHVIPVALGGANRMENLKLAHKYCNFCFGMVVRKKLHGY